jgi:hypothetical protein
MCRHLDRTNSFSCAHGGCGVFKRDRVASHAKTFHPQEQGTRDIGDLFEEGLRKERERMIALIKKAYWLAYEGMPMHKFYSLTTLLWHQNFKGLDGQRIHLGKKYVNSTAARDFSHALAAELRERMNADLRKARMFSVMLDESTDKGGKKNLLVYVRYPEKGRFVTKFWTVLEVERGDGRAERLLRMLVNHFKLMDVPIAKLAAYASDGASVVSSKRAGLAGLIAKGPAPLQGRFPGSSGRGPGNGGGDGRRE